MIFEGVYSEKQEHFIYGKKYYLNGNLKCEGEFYCDDSNLLFLMCFNNGKFKKYYENGNLKHEAEYLIGRLYNKYKKFYPNGALLFEGRYINGLKNGEGEEYYSNGKLKFKGTYINSRMWDGIGYNNKGKKNI